MDGSCSDVTVGFHAGNVSNSLIQTYTNVRLYQNTAIQQTKASLLHELLGTLPFERSTLHTRNAKSDPDDDEK